MIELSFIIVNWKTRDILRNCINSIYNTVQKIPFEIIVVDNGSADGSVDMIRNEFSHVNLIINNENLGFAAANNQGIRKSRGKFILLLNSDTIVLDKTIERTLSFMVRHEDAGAVGCKLLNPDSSLQPSCRNFFSFRRLILRKLIPKFLLQVYYQCKLENQIAYCNYNEIGYVDYVTGAFLLTKREVLKKIGLLDESFFMYGEEADLCLRIRKAGWRVYFYPFASIVHLGRASVKKETVEVVQRAVSVLLFRKKHYSYFTYFTYRVVFFVVTLSKYLIFKLFPSRNSTVNLLMYRLRAIWKMTYHV